MIKVNLGKNTIGDNNKMSINLRDYEMSTHDLSYVFRSTMGVGTLVPCLKLVAQKGDIIDMKMINKTLTHPTVGPLFGGYKLQHFIFNCPIRLYNSWLHNNKVGIGTKMEKVKLPMLEIKKTESFVPSVTGNYKTKSSSLLNYMGVKGARFKSEKQDAKARFNGLPILMYLDIFKNYFANTQEENAYYIGGTKGRKWSFAISEGREEWGINVRYVQEEKTYTEGIKLNNYDCLYIEGAKYLTDSQFEQLINGIKVKTASLPNKADTATEYSITQWGKWDSNERLFKFDKVGSGGQYLYSIKCTTDVSLYLTMNPFKLDSIDAIRERILMTKGDQTLIINDSTTNTEMKLLKDMLNKSDSNVMQGLLVKTYDSDVFNNWVNNETIEGVEGINEASAVAIVDGKLSMDALNLAQKVYNFLNRIAVAGNTYRDWLETAYTAGNYMERPETPMFEGGMTQFIEFEEVVSNAATTEEPLGTLAGRGKSSNAQGNGELHFKVSEPSYIIGIAAITPLIDYCQGNDWDMTNLRTMNDFHKPAFDGIGFEDSMNQQRAYWTANWDENGNFEDTAAGKAVAWINYMTNFNKTFGNFAAGESEEFMVMNRNYEADIEEKEISDLTTYIDPSKWNQVFAEQTLDAQNFWVQTAFNIKVRRNISAKQIPNL